jgi:hypothetical protein
MTQQLKFSHKRRDKNDTKHKKHKSPSNLPGLAEGLQQVKDQMSGAQGAPAIDLPADFAEPTYTQRPAKGTKIVLEDF